MMAMARGYERETSEPDQTRLLGRSQVRQLERKEEMSLSIGHCALRPTDDLNGRLAGYKRHVGLWPGWLPGHSMPGDESFLFIDRPPQRSSAAQFGTTTR